MALAPGAQIGNLCNYIGHKCDVPKDKWGQLELQLDGTEDVMVLPKDITCKEAYEMYIAVVPPPVSAGPPNQRSTSWRFAAR